MSRVSSHDLRHAAAARLVEFKATLPQTRDVQVCERIEPEATDGSIVVTGLDERYRHLLRPLPLGGAAAMREGAVGELVFTRRLLDAAPWLERPIRLIDRQLRVQLWAGRPWLRFRPLLLVGPPGCGKSHLARAIAEASGVGYATLDLGGVSDNRTLEGTARGWTSSQPCFPAVVINATQCANPVIALEEIDKAGGSARNGNSFATLLTMVEASTARAYFDKCLMAPVDLSHVNWIMIANRVDQIPAPLRSRLAVVEVAGPEPGQFDQLLTILVRSLAARWEISPAMLPELEPATVALLRRRFARHGSVRRAAAELEAVLAALIGLSPRRPH